MAAFNEPPGWVKDAVFYQIFPDRFAFSKRLPKPAGLEPWDSPPTFHGYKGGDLLGVAEKLDWLVDLGITAIYFNPIFQSGSNHRYHTHDYFRVDPLLGGNEAFDELIEACRARNIRVVLDGVLNHSSRGFFQFHDVLENGSGSIWADWFIIHDWPLHPYDADKPANYDAWWGLKALPKFNTDNPAVREYLMQVGEYWARKGIDGWRLDVPEEIQTPGFWEEFRERTRGVNPDLYIVGEVWGDASHYIADGSRFDGTMNYLLGTAIISFAAGSRVDPSMAVDNPWYRITPAVDAAGFRGRLDRVFAMYPDRANLANLNLLDSHDTARIWSIARGDRPSVLLSLLLLLTLPGAPCIYYGTEVGLPGAKDPDCRRGFPWDEHAWDAEILDGVRSLTALRHDHEALRSLDISHHVDDAAPMTYLAERKAANGSRLLVGVNVGDRPERAEAKGLVASDGFELLWGRGVAGAGATTSGLESTVVEIPARTGAVWSIR